LWIDINSDGNSTNTTSATSATSATNTTNAAASETQTLAQAGIIAIDFTSNPPHIIKADGSTTQLTVQTLTANILGTQYQNVQGGVLQQDEQRNADGTLAAPVQTLHAVNTRQFDGQAAHIRGGVVASATPGQWIRAQAAPDLIAANEFEPLALITLSASPVQFTTAACAQK
jgi:hypothetical protein